MSYIYLIIAIIIELGATSSLKASDGFTNWLYTTISLIGYGVSFYCLSMALREIPVGIAYAVWSGIGTVGICLLAWLIFKQNLSLISIVGIALIVVGVVIVNLGSAGHS
ncbi:multidrug efflux SMR transporter [Commensalibacter papalotli (ex Botero et al. 2024)]|uniref:Multidrug transporter EmrE and related cation transporters (EmrE) (PDB:2I68) n=1 Tax=Commensalibacter papalotli (ex Botero et al. 2024) TaxID=2972766 RepID=A0ABM9HKG3_9PROT|nr:multidrug efflux SMR transporter [Commensalibacter papalotli (ex Botero et al. 2024)]CAI3930910.1 Multidrug transporter EmrE and related cation transporters (EmrE) (PDB:2I68) [Commensalibacter papalotli (ex Botero et al. 2024)]